ncbi:hypothetical protein [Sphingomonas sp.]|jgi:hypothetical protein|uniref:hypothetical protein n=1 Tax=Sphingomonas sp. TaxID=28214 RepID=UPI001810D7DD|nr:hypothetical protein [Sphingomonas sp.]MBA3511249.1 hypothetical protein [Sphingomonas sp.]
MAGMREMALGIALTLRGGTAPNPLPIEFWGYAPADAAQLLKYVIDECADAQIALDEVRTDPVVVHELTGSKTEFGVAHRDVTIAADSRCVGRMDLYRADLGAVR